MRRNPSPSRRITLGYRLLRSIPMPLPAKVREPWRSLGTCWANETIGGLLTPTCGELGERPTSWATTPATRRYSKRRGLRGESPPCLTPSPA